MSTPDAKPTFARYMRGLGLQPDPWQEEVLEGRHPRLLLNCCRQAGKSTVVAVLSLLEAVWTPMTLVLLLSRSHRQSAELFRKVLFYSRMLRDTIVERKTADELCLRNLSRIVCLPCAEETIRGYSKVNIVVIDEAARVPDDLYRAVLPMLSVSNGRMICLSTPYGKRGFFYENWVHGGADWHRIEVAADRIPRITPEVLAQQRRTMGESWYRQEFCCSFEALEGLVYPDFARCVVNELPPHVAYYAALWRAPSNTKGVQNHPNDECPPNASPRREPRAGADEGGWHALSNAKGVQNYPNRGVFPTTGNASSLPSPLGGDRPFLLPSPLGGEGLGVRGTEPPAPSDHNHSPTSLRRVGGLDFGLRNPFAAVWGVLDRDDILWLTGEHYSRDQALAYHAARLPRDVMWYADPAGARETTELRCAGFHIQKGDNDQRPGIAAVRARLEHGQLKVLAGACPNLLSEAGLYHYDADKTSETPIKENDHALDALRYLVSKIDARLLARLRIGEPQSEGDADAAHALAKPPAKWLRLDNEELWTEVGTIWRG